MPDLPNVGVERDMESFREFFESPLFRADGLKIYPTLVIRGTGLYELWKTGRYSSNVLYSLEYIFLEPFISILVHRFFWGIKGAWKVKRLLI